MKKKKPALSSKQKREIESDLQAFRGYLVAFNLPKKIQDQALKEHRRTLTERALHPEKFPPQYITRHGHRYVLESSMPQAAAHNWVSGRSFESTPEVVFLTHIPLRGYSNWD